MRFSQAYAPAPVCAPTRISLQTGKSPAQNRWTKASRSYTASENYPLVPPQSIRSIPNDEITIGERLQSAGYATA
ncbi:MAG: sulfatase-like hydrolase/transferase, partial [Verrucomicrobiia bacterium]